MTELYWTKIGRKALAELPKYQHQPFIKWLADNEPKLGLYVRAPGEALRKWQDSIECWELDEPEVP